MRPAERDGVFGVFKATLIFRGQVEAVNNQVDGAPGDEIAVLQFGS
jgi:hypothetical protein